MFGDMIRELPCDVCENGKLIYSQKETAEAWQQPEIFRLDDLAFLKDGIISDVLVFVCMECGAQARYTFKELEKKFRKELSRRILTRIAKGYEPDPASIRNADRVFLYCGKCGGYDGKGSCPKYVYKVCEIKRMPYGF